MQRKNLKFIIGVNIDLIEKLPNKGIKYLLIFVDPCEEVSNCKQNHEHRHCWKTQGSVTIYNNYNLIPQGTLGSSLHKSWNQLKQPSQKKHSELEKLMKKLVTSGTEFFCKILRKSIFCHAKTLEQKSICVRNMDSIFLNKL